MAFVVPPLCELLSPQRYYKSRFPSTSILAKVLMKARDIGQLNSYVNWYHEHVPIYSWEQPPIGLLICQSAGAEEVRYALGGLERRLFVARYQVRLPKEQDIAAFLRQQREVLAE
jgi:hypothetical protein